MKRIYPELPNIDTLLDDPRTGLSKLELLLQRVVIERCRAAFLGNPFHIGIPLAFLLLCEMEIQDLTVLIEAKSSNTPAENVRAFLQMGTETAGA